MLPRVNNFDNKKNNMEYLFYDISLPFELCDFKLTTSRLTQDQLMKLVQINDIALTGVTRVEPISTRENDWTLFHP